MSQGRSTEYVRETNLGTKIHNSLYIKNYRFQWKHQYYYMLYFFFQSRGKLSRLHKSLPFYCFFLPVHHYFIFRLPLINLINFSSELLFSYCIYKICCCLKVWYFYSKSEGLVCTEIFWFFTQYISPVIKYILCFAIKCSRLTSFRFKLSSINHWSHIWLNSSLDGKRACYVF